MEKANFLVVVDAQNDFASGSLGSDEAVATIHNIVNMIELCGKDGFIIAATKDTHDDNYLETNEGKHLAIPHAIEGTEGWDIVPDIKKALENHNAAIVLKNTFGSMDLVGAIRALALNRLRMGIASGENLKVIIVGWCTDICVITNALLLKTAFPEAEIIVDSNCCAGVTPELHNAALVVMKSCQIDII